MNIDTYLKVLAVIIAATSLVLNLVLGIRAELRYRTEKKDEKHDKIVNTKRAKGELRKLLFIIKNLRQ